VSDALPATLDWAVLLATCSRRTRTSTSVRRRCRIPRVGAGRTDVESLRFAAAGLGTLGVDTLVTVGPNGDPGALGSLPESVRVDRFAPQGLLLPQVDVVVHHGGRGTLLGACSLGIPQCCFRTAPTSS
jgi:UDP:flavonoid glycosyltransferase YjiC (YdhE family)